MSLILANSNELVIGKAPPWPLYDAEQNPLLAQGEIIRDAKHRDSLLAGGACHEMSWEGSGNEDIGGSLFTPEETASGETAEDKTDKGFTFDDMKLKAEDRLQLEPPAKLGLERLSVKVIGFLRGASLLVTTPFTPNGQRLQLLENETVIMRSFSGQNAFAFASTIVRICKIPYEYLHLSFPDQIQGLVIRKAPRIKTRIIAAVQDSKFGAEKQISALISDISAKGISLDSKQQLGDKGDILNLAFRVQLHNIEALLSVKGVIRAVLSGEAEDAAKPAMVRHGIEFQNLQPNDSVVLQSMIYQQMIENPHKLV
ncbi:MAG: flagellar brake protein [Gallionellaceae bacterium]|jgi:hypothetical protein